MATDKYNIDTIKDVCKHLNIACSLLVYQDKFTFLYANNLYYQLYGYNKNDNFRFSVPFIKEHQDIIRTIINAINNKEKYIEFESRSFNKTNTLIWTSSKLSLFYNNNKVYIICLIIDITENKQTIKNLEISHQKYRQEGQFKVALATDALASYEINVDDDMIIEDIIEDTINMLHLVDLEAHCCYSEFLSRWAKKCVHPDEKDTFYQIMHPHNLKSAYYSNQTEVYYEYRSLTATGKQIWVSTSIHLLYDKESSKLFGFVYVKDINEKKLRELALLKQSQSDPLTGLSNRISLEKIISTELAANPHNNCAFMIIDIDNFKIINDNFGHSFGDTVLVEIANALLGLFTNSNIIGRYGGDEFVIFIKNYLSKEEVYDQANRILDALNLEFSSNEERYMISCSIGISFSPDHGNNYNDLFDKADIALYQAKRAGKSQYTVYDSNYNNSVPVTNYISKGWLIDELDEIVYVSTLDTYELLYLNRKGRELTGIKVGEYNHVKCYEALQGRTSPCPFCSNSKLTLDEFYIWEFSNPIFKKDYIVKDKLIMWEGIPVRMEMAVNISDAHKFNLQQVPTEFAIEKTILDCLRSLTIPDTLEEAINNVLEIIGNFYQASRAYIVEINLETKIATNTYEWSQEGTPSFKEQLKNIDLTKIPYILEVFEKKDDLIITDCQSIKQEHPLEYQHFISRGAHSLITIPYEEVGVFAGYIGVDNPKFNQNTIALLDSINFSIVNEIKKRRLYETTQYNLYHDNLSGLLNRNSFTYYLNNYRETTNSQAVVFADINGLKEINRDFGHNHGDKIITNIAQEMKAFFPNEKVFRLSGDEFVIVAANIDYQDFLKTAKMMDSKLLANTPNGVSLGYTWSGDGTDINELIHQAEELMLINKQVYYEQAEVYKKHYSPKKINNLLNVIENKYFVVYLQPKFDIRENKVVAAEALVRLNHPKYGLIMPGKFIPTLEKEQMTRYLDFYMFDEVCQILEQWANEGKELIPISVNISRNTLLESDFTDSLSKIKQKYHFPSKYIVIEITESIGNIEHTLITTISNQIKKLGFNISLDDFGARYANMSLLTTLNFDELKIDKSMIDTVVDNKKSQSILLHIIEMCKMINVSCVAEGVETKKQLEQLLMLGCSVIQGYYYSKPIPVVEFEAKYHQ